MRVHVQGKIKMTKDMVQDRTEIIKGVREMARDRINGHQTDIICTYSTGQGRNDGGHIRTGTKT